MSIYVKLLKIQKEVDNVQKNAKGFNFSYADGNAVLSKIRPLMVENNLLCVPCMKDNKTEQVFYKDKNGKEKRDFLFQANGSYIWIDGDNGEKLEIPWTFSGNNDDASQAQGNSLTYNERYFLLKFFKIATPTDDPDAKTYDKKPYTKPISSVNKTSDNNSDKVCDKCGSPMKLRKSARGEFYGCSNFPNCKNIVNIEPDYTEEELGGGINDETMPY